jgi:hypothetical protein
MTRAHFDERMSSALQAKGRLFRGEPLGAVNPEGGEAEAEAPQSMRPPGAERSRTGACKAGRKEGGKIRSARSDRG